MKQTLNFAQIAEKEKRYLIHTYDRLPVLMVSGEGCTLIDDQGKKYLDFLGGLAVNSLGHAHPEIMEVLRDGSETLLHVSNLLFHPYQADVAERLCRLSGLDRVFFCNSGTEAVEGALKLARAYARKQEGGDGKSTSKLEVLALEDSFHGRTVGALSATWPEKYRAPFEPLVPGVRFVSARDVKKLESGFRDTVGAFLIEIIQGEGGVVPLDESYLKRAQELCRAQGALLICDEIQCGLGRTGQPFAYQKFGLKPDIVLAAKPLAAGLPMGAILAREEVAEAFGPGSHGSTFGGGPLQCRLASKFLEILERPGFLDHVREMGGYLRSRLEELSDLPAVQKVRGEGLMMALVLEVPGKQIVKTLLDQGILINCTQEKILRFLPPLTIEREHVDRLAAALRRVLAGITKIPAGKGVPV
ncbi:MAG: aspartate aminotransferase family protein [Acidobacteria bacterium]|nr:aspartate aminotransferase family protein [Acidobacteriota bacterium]